MSTNKKFILFGLVAFIVVLFWISVKPWILAQANSSTNGDGWLLPVLTFILAIAITGLAFYLLNNYKLGLLTSVVIGLTFLLVFGLHPLFFAGIGVMLLSHFIALDRIIGDARSRIVVHPRGSIGRGFTFIVTSFLVLLATVYYVQPSIQQSASTRELPARFKQMIRDVSGTILKKEFSQLPPREQTAAQNQIVQQINSVFNDLIGPYRQFVPFALTLILFLLLQSLGILATTIAGYVSGGMFVILKNMGFVHIAEKDIKAQRMVF